jgi:hypothetical protein
MNCPLSITNGTLVLSPATHEYETILNSKQISCQQGCGGIERFGQARCGTKHVTHAFFTVRI